MSNVGGCPQGLTTFALQPADKFHITLINRHWEKARSMVNAVDIANRIKRMPQVASIR